MANEITRREQFYAAILGEGQIPEPKTREEQYLQRIAQNGSGGGGTTVVANPEGEATDELEKIQIGSNIYSIPEEVTDYDDLSNKPQINGVTLQGDKSISDLFDGKVDIGVGTVEESGYAELKDENGDRIFRASSANGEASVESGGLIGQPGALVLYNGEGGVSSVHPKGGVILVDVDLPAENGTLALDSQIASSQTPAKAAVVSVPDAAPINAEDITVDITPVQLGSGTPSPDNIRPIEGWTGAELDRVGVNHYNKATVTAGKYMNIDGTVTDWGSVCYSDYIKVKPGSSYYLEHVLGNSYGLSAICFDEHKNALNYSIGVVGEGDGSGAVVTPSKCAYIVINGLTSNIDIIQVTEGNTAPANYEPYQGQQYTVNFGETVYGGKWHVTAGGTDKTHGNITNYNGETINEPWLSSMDEYSPGATPTTGAQVVYPLTTPTTISTPKQNVPMLQGINTVYADCGDTQLKYQPDNVIGELKGMIQALDARVTALEEAE